MNFKFISFVAHDDARRKLVALEELNEVSSEVKYVYYMFDALPNETNEFHVPKKFRIYKEL